MAAISADLHVHSGIPGEDKFLDRVTPQKMFDYALGPGCLNVMAVTDARYDVFFDSVTNNPGKYLEGIRMVDANSEIAMFEKDVPGLAGMSRKLYLIRGMEHHDDQGSHILQIGGKRPIVYDANRSLIDRLKYAKDEGALSGLAHPFCENFGGATLKTLEKLAPHADFIEQFNNLSKKEYNEMTRQFVEEHGYRGLSNSDDHTGKPGRVRTLIDCETLGIDLDQAAERIKGSIKHGEILGQVENYASFLEKVNTFVLGDIMAGDFNPALNRVRRGLGFQEK